MLELAPHHLAIVKDILHRHLPNARVLAFGSRAKGTAARFSDLDLAVEAGWPLSLRTLALLEVDFAESDLPMKVDVVGLHSIASAFRQRVEREGRELP